VKADRRQQRLVRQGTDGAMLAMYVRLSTVTACQTEWAGDTPLPLQASNTLWTLKHHASSSSPVSWPLPSG